MLDIPEWERLNRRAILTEVRPVYTARIGILLSFGLTFFPAFLLAQEVPATGNPARRRLRSNGRGNA